MKKLKKKKKKKESKKITTPTFDTVRHILGLKKRKKRK